MVKEKKSIELRKAIDYYWASKRKTYATGRIKRMRKNEGSMRYFKSKHRRYGAKLSYKIYFYTKPYPTLTRWNKH